MKLGALLLFPVLAGCLSAADVAQNKAITDQIEAAQYQRRLNDRCNSYGFRDGTPEFRNCLMQVDMANRQQDEAQRQMLLQQYLQQQGIFRR